jgi:hypothetical protein
VAGTAAPVQRAASFGHRERVQPAGSLHPAGAPDLAVGDHVQAGVFLQLDRVQRRVVEDCLVGQAAAAGGAQDRRAAQQAADRLRPGLARAGLPGPWLLRS